MKWRHLGDTILWTAALQALGEWDPQASVELALPAPYVSLFEKDDRFSRVWGLSDDAASLQAVKTSLKARPFDVVLNFHASQKSRALCEAVATKLRLIHHHDRLGKTFGSERPIVGLGQPMAAIERDLNVVRTLGWNGKSPETSLRLPPEWAIAARDRWLAQSSATKPVLVLAPSASRPAKIWPLENFSRLAETLAPKWEIVVPYESEATFEGRAWQRGQLARHARLIHTPHLSDLAGLLSLARAFVGGDSGAKHLAAALGVSTVTLFGPESVGEWHGYSTTKHTAIQKEVGCRDNDPEDRRFAWCGEAICPLASHACLSLITVEEVAAEIEKKSALGI